MTWTQSIVFTFLSLIKIILMSAIIQPSCSLSLQSENTCYHGHLEMVNKSKKTERPGGLKNVGHWSPSSSCQVPQINLTSNGTDNILSKLNLKCCLSKFCLL